MWYDTSRQTVSIVLVDGWSWWNAIWCYITAHMKCIYIADIIESLKICMSSMAIIFVIWAAHMMRKTESTLQLQMVWRHLALGYMYYQTQYWLRDTTNCGEWWPRLEEWMSKMIGWTQYSKFTHLRVSNINDVVFRAPKQDYVQTLWYVRTLDIWVPTAISCWNEGQWMSKMMDPIVDKYKINSTWIAECLAHQHACFRAPYKAMYGHYAMYGHNMVQNTFGHSWNENECPEWRTQR